MVKILGHRFRGQYKIGRQYYYNDVVESNRTLYRCDSSFVKNVAPYEPHSSTTWVFLATLKTEPYIPSHIKDRIGRIRKQVELKHEPEDVFTSMIDLIEVLSRAKA